jgi:hypothetical protein
MPSTRWRLLIALVVAAACGGCDNTASQKEALDELLKANEDLLAVLKGVQDEASMQKARPELRKISWRLDKLGKKLKALGEPSREMLTDFAAIRDLQQEIISESVRITRLPGGQEFVDGMKHL